MKSDRQIPVSNDKVAALLRSGKSAEVTVRNWVAERDKTNTVVMYDKDMPPNEASPEHGGLCYAERRPDTPPGQYYQL